MKKYSNSSSNVNSTVSFHDFYDEYHGHKVSHLRILLPSLQESCDSLIWTAGDSSLDNKYWFNNTADAPGAYGQVLRPPLAKKDVTYWLNFLAGSVSSSKGKKVGAINTAVEATTLNQRSRSLLAQDMFLRDNINSDDILLVSIGGNDVAMMPAPCTIISMAGLLCLPVQCIEHGITCCKVPMNDYCCGCGSSLLSCFSSCPPCLGYFHHLFGVRVQKYIEQLTARTKPKKILVCMIYYLDENQEPSWAGKALSAMGYNKDPSQLQAFIKKVFQEATSNIKIDGSEVIPVPLFNVLDGKNSSDYIARVEPSAQGGMKMAEYILNTISKTSTVNEHIMPSTPLVMSDR